jgi:predicted NBD/HSP70 family sugar kinase
MNPHFQHIINRSAVFHYLREYGPTYRTKISIALGISLPSVARALQSLSTDGFVELMEYRKNSQDRTVPFYRITIKDNIMISVDLLKNIIAVFDTTGLYTTQDFKIPADDDIQTAIVRTIDQFVDVVLKKDRRLIKSICIGSPGIVDVEKGMVIKAIYHPDFEGIPLKSILKDTYKCTVFIDNVVNLAVYANYIEFDKNYKNIIACDIGMEIGTGLMINGKIYHGENYRAGETGFFTDNLADPGINYKKLLTFRALNAEFLKRHKGEITDSANQDEETCLQNISSLFTLANQGDKLALEIIDEYIKKIALMLNKAEVLLNPKIIVISGDICQMPYSENVFLKPLNKYFTGLRLMENEIKYSKYGTLVAIYGAGEFALENYLCEEFPYMMGI